MTKLFRVITPRGNAWTARFHTEAAAWARILATTTPPPHLFSDTFDRRAALVKEGWKVEGLVEGPAP